MARHIIVAVVVARLFSAVAVAQPAPDFSGQWILVSAPGQTTPPETLRIEPIMVTATAAGLAVPPRLRALSFERTTGSERTKTTVEIGVESGTTSGLPRPDTLSRQGARRVGAHLVVWRTDRVSADGQTTDVEKTEDWSIDAVGMLVIATQVRHAGGEPVQTTRNYRRQR
jgi:hypothetical protein